jgi:serine phosphatase RsbU (regulator of sigma subunit)
VCGRGPCAATLNAQVRFATRALARAGLEPTAIAERINDNVVADVGDQRFCTAVFAALDIGETLVAELVSAGHPSPMVLRADGTVATISTSGPLLGVLTSATYESTRVEIARGDTLVVLTDGLLEARDPAGDFFEPLLMPLLERMAARSVEEVAEAITAAVSAFTEGHTNDDIAVVVIQPTA